VNFSAQQTGEKCTANCRFNHIIVSQHSCKEYLNAVKLKKTVLTPDKVLNVFIYELLCSDQIQYVGERLKWSQHVNGE